MDEIQHIISGFMTGLLFILFIGICVWSWSSKRTEIFEQMSRLPLDDGNFHSIRDISRTTDNRTSTRASSQRTNSEALR